jgi:hypothetical protein
VNHKVIKRTTTFILIILYNNIIHFPAVEGEVANPIPPEEEEVVQDTVPIRMNALITRSNALCSGQPHWLPQPTPNYPDHRRLMFRRLFKQS